MTKTRKYRISVDLSDEEQEQLYYILSKVDMGTSDFIRLIIGFYYDELKGKERSHEEM